MPRWIVITNWDKFQHYKDRDPKWVKVWTRLLSDDDYISLSFHLRGVLQSLWMAYATSNGQLIDTTSTLNRQLGHRVMTRDLEALNHAGFITYSGTKPAQIRTPEKEKETKGFNKTSKSDTQSPEFIIATMIRNGAIPDRLTLEAELRARNLNGDVATRLHALLPSGADLNQSASPDDDIPF